MYKNYYLLLIIIFYSFSYSVEAEDVNVVEEETFVNEKFQFIQEIYSESWALLIGINDYQNVDPLGYAVDDATKIRSLLIEKYGFPEDNIKTMTETLDLAIDLQCEHSNFYSAQALPGSPLYLYAKDQNWDIPETYEEFAFLSHDCKPLRTKYLSNKEVLKFRDDAWHKYFSNKNYLDLVQKTFGENAKKNIIKLSKIKLKRKILEN